MAISRFEKFAPVDFDRMAYTVPDVQGLSNLLGSFQQEYNLGNQKISEATFKNLEQDAIESKNLRESQNQMIDDISGKYTQDVSQGRRAMAQGLIDLGRDYKPGGKRYSINKNYESFMTAREELKKRIGKDEKAGGITQRQFDAWQGYTMDNYGGVKPDQFGIYNDISIDEVAGYVNGNLRAEELAKNWQPDKLKDGRWYSKDGMIYKKSTNGEEVVREEEILDELTKALGRDAELTNYLSQYAKHIGTDIDLSNIGKYTSKDNFEYNYNNPLVQFAKTAAKKWSYKNVEHDEDINLSLEHQQRQFAYGDRKDKERLMFDPVITMDNNDSLANQYSNINAIQTKTKLLDDNISSLQKTLTDKNLSPLDRQNAQALLNQYTLEKQNTEILMNKALEKAPEYKNSIAAVNESLTTNNISNSLHDNAMATVNTVTTKASTRLVKDGDGGYTTEITNVSPTELATIKATAYMNYINKNGGNINLQKANTIVKLQDNTSTLATKYEKGINTYLAENAKTYKIAQPELSVDSRDFVKTETGTLPIETPFNNVSRDLKHDPGIFTMHDPATGITASGQDFYKKLGEELGVELDYESAVMHKYSPSTKYFERGKNSSANSGGKATIKSKDGLNTYQFQFQFGKASEHHVTKIEDYYLNYGNEESKNLIATQKARQEDPGVAYGRYENGAQDKVIIHMPLQMGQDPTDLSNSITLIRKQNTNKQLPAKHVINIGRKEYEFEEANDAQLYGQMLANLGNSISGMDKESAKEYLTKFNPFKSEEELDNFINHLK